MVQDLTFLYETKSVNLENASFFLLEWCQNKIFLLECCQTRFFCLKNYNDIMSLKHHLEPLYSSNLNNFCTEQRKSTWFDTRYEKKKLRFFKSACTTLIEMEQYKQLVHYALAFCSQLKNIASTCKFSFISLEFHKPLEKISEIVV